jgi:hypothetical protein
MTSTSVACSALVSLLAMYSPQEIAVAQNDLSTTSNDLIAYGDACVSSEQQENVRVNQLDVPQGANWEEQLKRLVFSAQFVNGKDIAVLDAIFSEKPLTEKEGRSDVDLYLVIRIQTKERLSYFPGPLTFRMLPDDNWPFGEASLPGPFTVPSMGAKEGVVYYTKHLWGGAEGSRIKFNKILTSRRWRFRVVDAIFK